jgi:hypothetical protein
MEVKEGTAKMASYGLPVQGVLLERDGCVDTRVEVVKLLEKILTKADKDVRYTIADDDVALSKAIGISKKWNGDKPTLKLISHEKPRL